jgi:Family of unknown function (DUF5652)
VYPQNFYNSWAPSFGAHWSFGAWGPFWGLLLVLLIIWSIAWKGLALWKSARVGSKVWFVILLIVNTAGVLEILYLYVFSRKSAPVMSEAAKTNTDAK